MCLYKYIKHIFNYLIEKIMDNLLSKFFSQILLLEKILKFLYAS